MDILIKLYGFLAKSVENTNIILTNAGEDNESEGYKKLSIECNATGNTDISSILKTLNIPEKSVSLTTVNGIRSTPFSTVKEKDRIKFYPFVAGG